MKKSIKIASIITVLLLTCLLLYTFSKTHITGDAQLIYNFSGKNVSVKLEDADSQKLKKIFNEKSLYFDSPSCGFDDDIAIKFGNRRYCIACDNCGIIKYGFRYFSVSDTEREYVNSVFKKYDCTFPCY